MFDPKDWVCPACDGSGRRVRCTAFGYVESECDICKAFKIR